MGNCGKLQAVFFLALFPPFLRVYGPGFLGRVNDSSLGILLSNVVALLQEAGGVIHRGGKIK